MDLDRAIDDLYALPPEDFTAARDAQVAAARESGDGKSAAALRRVRRPSRSAWLANQLVRHRGEELDQLLDLGSALREAQNALAGDDLRRLSAQRRSVVSALARDARELADELGYPVNEAVVREVESTLDAALADHEVADQLRKGRLTAALQHSGFGTGFEGTTDRPRAKARTPARQTVDQDDSLPQARAALTAARSDVKDAEKHERAEEAKLASAATHREKTVRRVAQLEEDLAHARQEDSAAADAVRAAHRRRDLAAKAANAARQKQARAEERLKDR